MAEVAMPGAQMLPLIVGGADDKSTAVVAKEPVKEADIVVEAANDKSVESKEKAET